MLNALSNLYRTAWLDLVFKDRNKSYGAYVLRTESSKNLLRAFFITAPLFTLSIALPQVLSRLNPVSDVQQTDRIVDVQKLTPPPAKLAAPKDEAAIPLPKQEKIKSVKITANIRVVEQPVSPDEMPSIDDLKDAAVSSVTQQGISSAVQLPTTSVSHGAGGLADTPAADNSIREASSLDSYPEFEGGMAAWAKYLQKNLRYPLQAQEEGSQGKVFVSFVIEKDGSISNVTVIRGVVASLDQEALRVIQKSPKWKPGIQNKQLVRVRYNIPISFSLAQ
jgi:protein TonB